MPFWRFKRDKEPADVELVGRVVTTTARDGARLRAKLTVTFEEPQTQQVSEEAGDRCQSVAVQVLAKVQKHENLMADASDMQSHVDELVAELRRRLPDGLPHVRSLELAAIHVVGDMSTSQARTPTWRKLEAVAPASKVPAKGQPPSAPPPRRQSSSQMFAVTAERLVPPGASHDIAGKAIAPLVRDAAGRLLVCILRCYDLIFVRELELDESSGLLAALVPTSDVGPGKYEESRRTEIERWEGTVGEDAVEKLRRESAIVAAFLMYQNLLHSDVPVSATVEIMEAVNERAFPEEAGILVEMARYLQTAESTGPELSTRVLSALEQETETDQLESALAPLLSALTDDLGLAANHVKRSARIISRTIPPASEPPPPAPDKS